MLKPDHKGLTLIELVVSSTISAILLGGLFVISNNLQKNSDDFSAKSELDLALAKIAVEIIQRGATAANSCSESGGALVCSSERASVPYEFRYALVGNSIQLQERKPPAAFATVKTFPNISAFSVCQASKPGCAISNNLLHAAGAGNQNTRYFRFALEGTIAKGDKTLTATALREYKPRLQSAFFVRNPFLGADPSIKIISGKKI